MSNWDNFLEFCDKQKYDPEEAKKFFKDITRPVAGTLEIDLDQVEAVKTVKSRSLVRQARKIWRGNSPRRIDRAIKRKRLAIKRREERREVIVRKNRREKDPLRRRINLNLIQIIEDEINRFLSEVQKCEERMDEITPVSEEK